MSSNSMHACLNNIMVLPFLWSWKTFPLTYKFSFYLCVLFHVYPWNCWREKFSHTLDNPDLLLDTAWLSLKIQSENFIMNTIGHKFTTTVTHSHLCAWIWSSSPALLTLEASDTYHFCSHCRKLILAILSGRTDRLELVKRVLMTKKNIPNRRRFFMPS